MTQPGGQAERLARRGVLCGLAALVIVSLPIGCDDQKTEDGEAHLKITDLSRNGNKPRARPSVAMEVHSLVFPTEAPRLAVALEALDPPPINDKKLALWQRNGFGLARLPRQRLRLFTSALTKALPTRRVVRFRPGLVYNEIPLAAPGRGHRKVRLADADGTTRQRRFAGGRYKMMIRLIPPMVSPDDAVSPDESLALATTVEVLPHHYGPRATVWPRTAEEQAMDGTSFHELHIAHPLTSDDVWIIWAMAASGAQRQAGAGQANGDDSAEIYRTGEPDLQPAPRRTEPATLAEAMLLGRMQKRNVQVVLLLVPTL